MNLTPIINTFQIKGTYITTETINSGYINATYKINTTQASYILQKVNHHIFKNVKELTQNIIRITEHIKAKTPKENQENTLEVILTNTNNGFYKDDEGNFWRMFNYLPDSITFEILQNPSQATALGIAFATFQKQLIDLPEPPLFEILPNFHNTSIRIEQFKEAIKNNVDNRLATVEEEVTYLLNLALEMEEVVNLGKQQLIPLRSIHQDAKLSNILFNQHNETLCIIDLDTTMPGYLCYDFGDAVRTGMNTAGEEEKDISKVGLHFDLFKAFAKGYASVSKDFITPKEIDTLVLGAKIITYEQAIRFLADYLNGDIYYQTSYPEHNLIRTKVQIALLKDILAHYEEMCAYVKKQYPL